MEISKFKKFKILMITLLFALLASQSLKAESIVDNKVSINIDEYDISAGWLAGDNKTVNVVVDFDDGTSSDKTVTITLPEGLRYVSYPSANPETSGGLAAVEKQASGTLGSLLDSTTHASQSPTSANSYTNSITYKFKDTTEKAEINFLATVDGYLYYGEKTFAADNGITASAMMNSSSIGDAKMDIKAIGNTGFDVSINGVAGNTFYKSEYTVLQGDTDQVKVGDVYGYRSGYTYGGEPFCAKEYELTFNYPINSGISVADVYDNDTSGATRTISDDPTTGTIKVKYTRESNAAACTYAYFTTIVFDTSNATVGSYQYLNNGNLQPLYVTYTMYDGTEVQTNLANALTNSIISPKFNVVENVGEKLNVYALSTMSYDSDVTNYQTAVSYEITNDLLSVKKDQVFEYTPGPNFLTTQLVLPDLTKSFKYKTNLSADYIEVSLSDLGKTNSPLFDTLTFEVSSANLAPGEYITSAIAELNDVPKNYRNRPLELQYTIYARALGVLDGVDSETITFKTYKQDDQGNPVADTTSSATTNVIRTDLSVGFERGIASHAIEAGDTRNVLAVINHNLYYYENGVGITKPAIYFKLPAGVTLDKDSFTVTADGESNPITCTVSDPYTLANGDRYVEIVVNHEVGGYFAGGKTYQTLYVNFNIQTSILASGNYNFQDLMFLTDKSNQTKAGNYGGGNVAPIVDVNDIDRDGDTTEKIMPFRPATLSIIPKADLLVDTYIEPSANSGRAADYDTSKPETAINFTPGTEAVYTVEVYNNRNDSVGTKSDFTSWIPVPKDGLNFGTDFQENEGYWNMKLGSVQPVIKVYEVDPNTGAETDVSASKAANYKIEYSSDASNASDYVGATYSSTMDPNTTMIRVTNTAGIDMQEKAVIEFVYVVDETATSVENTDKLGSINDFRPYYYFSAGSAGYASGTRVGAKLVIGEISGMVFKDNNKNSIYDSGDTGLSNIEMGLLVKDGSGQYVPYVPSGQTNQLTSTTDSDGTYDFENLPNGDYKIDFSNVTADGGVFSIKDVGDNDEIDSDVYYTGSDVGTLDGIDPTMGSSKYIFAGLLDYNPPVDLKLGVTNIINPPANDEDNINNISTTVTLLAPLNGTGSANSKNLNLYLEPDFFADIADKSYDEDGLKLENSDGIIISYFNSGVLSDQGTYLITPLTITGLKVGNATIKGSIKDLYGQNREVTINVVVLPNTSPVLTTTNETIKVGESLDLTTLASASDPEDGALTPTIKDNGGFNNKKVGTYTITYEASDKDGNKVTKTATVTVNPIIVSGTVFDDTSNYNSKNDDNAYVKEVTINLIDRDSKEVLATTKSNASGKYSLSITGNEKSTIVDKYAIEVRLPNSYILANDKSSQTDSESIISLNDKTSISTYEILGQDYLNQDIGMALNVVASIVPNKHKIYVGDKVTSNITVEHGSIYSSDINNNHVNTSVPANGDLSTSIDIEGISKGKTTISIVFQNGYQRISDNITRTVEIEILPLPKETDINGLKSNKKPNSKDLPITGNGYLMIAALIASLGFGSLLVYRRR